MPCYSVSPAYRRNIVHVNPFYNPYHHAQQVVFQPRYSVPALFRSLEADLAQFDNFFREVDAGLKSAAREQKPFQPRFDIKEESDKYVLNGELPGVQPENLSIEFVDNNTMVVKGKVVRTETRGSPSAQASQPTEEQQVESQQQQSSESEDVSMSGALPDSTSDTASVSSASNYQKASVEDEEGAENSASTSTPAEEQSSKTTPEQPAQQEVVAKPVEQPQSQESQYVVNERTVGSFSRAFRFPGKVNQDAVHAALKDGILTVSVPKYVEQDSRRKIEVQGA